MLELRPLHRGDVDAVLSLIRRSEVHDHEPLVTPREEIVEMFEEPHFDPTLDGRLVTIDGVPVAYGRVWHRPSGVRLERAYLLGTVDPGHRGRGVGRALFSWQVERATVLLSAYTHDLPRYLRTSAWDSLTGAHHLYERFGFRPVRWFDELVRPLEPAPDYEAPTGVEVVPWQSERAEELRLVHNAAFADHWGSTPSDPESWHKMLGDYGMRLDLSYIAIIDGRSVGYSLNEVYPEDEALLGRREGWIGTLGVLGEARGRGVATALIAASLRAFLRAGLTHAAIGVDTDNPSGAHLLYRRLGFQTSQRSVTHEREL